MSLLELEAVTYAYPGARAPALDQVSLTVEPGEFVVVAGGSGSGKSTLLRLANGLVPHFHGGRFSGSARIGGLDIREHGPSELAQITGSLFQDPETQVVMGTPRAELSFPLENQGRGAAEVARGVQEAALALGIEPLLDRSTAELSGGELQRVALGAALVGAPALLALDEPTSQLDPVAGDELIGTLRRLNDDADVAILLAEHRLERCLSAADRVIVLRAGRVVCDAEPAEFLEWALDSQPELATPGSRLLRGLGFSALPGVKGARGMLRRAGVDARTNLPEAAAGPAGRVGLAPSARAPSALRLTRVWYEIPKGPSVLRGVSLKLEPGERVALMGANGAGKSTLLRLVGGLTGPSRGKVDVAGRAALLLQNPSDYLVAERVADEASAAALARVGLGELASRHPRDLSGGERQRLALAIVIGDEIPGLVLLDEPTRGMDRRHKASLVELLHASGAAILVATHDPEFAVSFAQRVVLLGSGRVIADGTPRELLGSGLYYATETARILDGRALTADEGVELLRARHSLAGQPELAV